MSSTPIGGVVLPVMACDNCHEVLLIPFLGEPTPLEYFEKVECHRCHPDEQVKYERRMTRWIEEWYFRPDPKSDLKDYLGWTTEQLAAWTATGDFPSVIVRKS